MKKFCPKCGVTIEIGTFCSKCQTKNLKYKPVKIKLCPSKKCFYRGKWTSFKDLKKLTERLMKESTGENVKVIEGLEKYDDLLEKSGLKKEINVRIRKGNEEYSIPINVEVTYSPGMEKVGSTYFQGILQLRNATPEVKDYVKNLVAKNKNMFINKVVEKNTSADYYFINKHQINFVALKIIRNFGGFMSLNPQLFSKDKQTSKDLYRLNVQVTLPKFKINDVILYDKDLLLVKKTGKEINGFDLIKGKRKVLKFTEKNADSFNLLKQTKTTLTRTKPSLKILNPQTYQEEPLNNPFKIKLKNEKKVVVVEFKKKFYLIR